MKNQNIQSSLSQLFRRGLPSPYPRREGGATRRPRNNDRRLFLSRGRFVHLPYSQLRLYRGQFGGSAMFRYYLVAAVLFLVAIAPDVALAFRVPE
jgi:hypothetical protein